MLDVAPTGAQDRSSAASTETTNVGVYAGGQFGALGGTSLWSPYDLVDGSGSHFGGFNIGYLRRAPSGVAVGGEADLSFGAEPGRSNGASTETPQLFGSVRGRVGYGPRRWFAYGTGGFAWTRNRRTSDPPVDGMAPTTIFRQQVGWTIGGGLERSIDKNWSANAEYLY